MSRIGKKPIIIPPGVEVKVDGTTVTVKGPKGELKKNFPALVSFSVSENKVLVVPKDQRDKINWGLNRALLGNMIKGVSAGFEKVLEFSGVGFKAQARQAGQNQELELNLGYTNPVVIKGLPGVAFQVEKNTIRVMGMSRQDVGQVAAQIRAARPPEPYKGSGIKYQDEIIIRKAGKKAVTGT